MQSGKILISAVVGTSAMTLFSYLISESNNKNFREPELLGNLIERLPATTSDSKRVAQLASWGLHYTLGTLFVTAYDKLWKKTKVAPSLTSGTLLGAASGVVGVVGWKLLFESHPHPPANNLKPFFGHLILAHVVFGIFSALTHQHQLTDESKIPDVDTYASR